MKSLRVTTALILGAVGSQLSAEAFNNDSIVALTEAGVGDDVLIAKINTVPCDYNVSTDSIIALKKAGVSSSVIAAMVNRCTGATRAQGGENATADPMVKRKPGLYVNHAKGDGVDIRVIRPTLVNGFQVSGNGSLLFPFKARLTVAQATAQTVISSQIPIFYFYFESADNRAGDFGTSESQAAQSPSEFSLVNLKVKSGQREIEIGKIKGTEASVGVDPKKTIPFVVSELGDGIFKVEVKVPLVPGEYAFLLKAGAQAYRVYDFTIK